MQTFFRTLGLSLVLAAVAPAFATGCATDTVGESTANSTERTGRFELFEGADGQFYFHLLAGNGELVLDSEGYTTKASAKNGIESVVENGLDSARYEILEAVNGEYYFNLKAGNHEIIGTSELYASKSGAEKGVETVMGLLDDVSIDELLSGDPKFETFEGQDGDHYFRLRAKNGAIVLQSEGYGSYSGAMDAVETVKGLAGHVESYEVLEAQNGQHFFHIVADNHEIVARGEMYASKHNAERGAENVRRLVREMTETKATDADVEAALRLAAEGAIYISEGDYGFSYVGAEIDEGAAITDALVREAFAQYIDNDPDTDKPLADLYVMKGEWDGWFTDAAACGEEDDDYYAEMCLEQAQMDAALAENLTDIQIFYFGSYGGTYTDGNGDEVEYVDGVAVSIVIVGRTPEGNLAGVRTIAIWT